MPYDPRMLQMAQMGIGMMGPQQGSPFANQPPRQRNWWEQPIPAGRMGGAQSPQDDPSNPDDPNAPKKKPQPSLLQMLMGGPSTYSGPPTGGGAGPSAPPWMYLGGMGLPGGGGWGGQRTPGY